MFIMRSISKVSKYTSMGHKSDTGATNKVFGDRDSLFYSNY